MNQTLESFLYLVAAVAFIVGLKRLTSPATARNGNRLAALGMLLAVITTLLDSGVVSLTGIIAGIIVGSAIGVVAAKQIAMTDMPQLVAAFNGFGGGASAFVAATEFIRHPDAIDTRISIALSVLIGSITMTGSFVAFAKLQGLVSGNPISFKGQKWFDSLIALAILVLGVLLVTSPTSLVFWVLTLLSLVIGVTRILPIGGADMPVVIAFLNAASGLAAAAAGFVIGSNVLIISGALVGASGLILTSIMVKAMNRTLIGVLAGGFGGTSGPQAEIGQKPVKRATSDDVAITLAYARSVIVVPGYGLAVAQAQHVMKDLVNALQERNVEVRFAIHPVAGRMPGHMNVLLAEADVPYDQLYDLETINRDFGRTDVALVVGANDVVNPAARTDANSPIYGMPILDVDAATTCVVIKRSLSPGFAGIDNPLFYLDGTLMLFDDARKALSDLVTAVNNV
ncbi:MAG: NAD(P)(+) transhydrogenase (Re/Si-specific) subunit beta [Acidimicrobiia bacterium]|nr:NAD(P)(+) transhydrogenase (Re/Si-specific) subunit beta [Acidimicrobiia bacterium]